MSHLSEQSEKLIEEAAKRLLTRASDSRSLRVEDLSQRIKSAIEKYLLRDDPDTSLETINDFCDSLYADDLCLIVACESGDQFAWNDLVEKFSPTVRSAARSVSGNEDAAEDLAQSIWAELYGLRVRKDGKPAGKISYYSGRGSLGGWLRAVVGQLAVDHHRKVARLVQTEEDADFDRLARDSNQTNEIFVTAQSVTNPEDNLTVKRATEHIEKALAKAMSELETEDRLLVKLYYFDGLRLREAGVVLGVHEATASRRLTKIHSVLRKRVEAILMKEHDWTKAETANAFSEIATELGSDLEILLGEPIAETKV